MDPLDPSLVVPALVGAIVTLAGIVYKMLGDRVKSQDSQIKQLGQLNADMQRDFGKSLSTAEGQANRIDRILNLVEDIRDDVRIPVSRPGATKARSRSGPPNHGG